MSLLERIHEKYVRDRRASVLSRHLANLLATRSTVLDVGCGDGRIAALVLESRPDVTIEGLEVQVRADSAIPIRKFDGKHLPAADASYDVVSMIDVLHHTDDPRQLLGEARRVARQSIVIKDHNLDGCGAQATLRWMDGVGNRRHGVQLPYNYLRRAQWSEMFAELDLRVDVYLDRLALYPWLTRPLLERSLHFITVLGKA